MKYGILLALVTLAAMTVAIYFALQCAQKIIDASKSKLSEYQLRQNEFYRSVATIAVSRSIFNEEAIRLNLSAAVKETHWQPVVQLFKTRRGRCSSSTISRSTSA